MKTEELTKLTTIRRLFDIKDGEEIKPGVKAFLESMTERKYNDGDTIVSYGADADDGMYVIISGEANVYDKEGEHINQLQEGDVIGELALINDERRAATVSAKGEVRCANVTRELFEEIIVSNRKIIGSFLSMLYRRTSGLIVERNEIKYRSEHDQLTGLYNKGKYLELLKTTFNNLDSIGIFNMDVNNLKKINDSMGHEYGDKLIIKAADSIRAVTNSKILGFRMGGDEYVIVACNVTEKEVYNIKDNWEAELKRLNEIEDGIECVIAVGIVYANAPYDYAKLYQQADNLMYEDKRQKKKG